MEISPALTTLFVAVAGPLGIILGWWLGKRSERELQAREERKSAYVAFVHASIRYRNASDEERRSHRDERWAALAEVVIVAPAPVVEAASYMVVTGDRLLDPTLSSDARLAAFRELWEHNVKFTKLARTDLRVGAADPFEGMRPVIGERIIFEPPSNKPDPSP